MTSWSKPVHEDFTTIEIANPTPGVEWALADPRIEALLSELATRVADRLDAEGVRYNTTFNAGEASGSLAEAGSVSGLSDVIANLVVERLAVLDRGPEPAALPTSEDAPFDPLSSFAYVPANAAIAESAAPWRGGDGLGRERMGWDAHNGLWDNRFEPVEAAAVLMPFDHIYVDPTGPALPGDFASAPLGDIVKDLPMSREALAPEIFDTQMDDVFRQDGLLDQIYEAPAPMSWDSGSIYDPMTAHIAPLSEYDYRDLGHGDLFGF